MKGLDFITEVKIKMAQEKEVGLFDFISNALAALIDYITPLKGPLSVINANHIRPIQSFFTFFRTLFSASLAQWIIFTYFFVYQELN